MKAIIIKGCSKAVSGFSFFGIKISWEYSPFSFQSHCFQSTATTEAAVLRSSSSTVARSDSNSRGCAWGVYFIGELILSVIYSKLLSNEFCLLSNDFVLNNCTMLYSNLLRTLLLSVPIHNKYSQPNQNGTTCLSKMPGCCPSCPFLQSVRVQGFPRHQRSWHKGTWQMVCTSIWCSIFFSVHKTPPHCRLTPCETTWSSMFVGFKSIHSCKVFFDFSDVLVL